MVSTRQLLEVGLGKHALRYREQIGRLHRVHQGVYAVGRRKLTREGVWMAAVLAYGPDAVLSHRSAALLWGLIASPGSKIDVTAATAKRSRGRIRAHRGTLHAEDIATRNGIPVTSVARTILDLAAAAFDEDRLTRVIEAADRLELFDLRKLDRAMARSPRRAGVPKLRRILADYRDPGDIRSELERDFLGLIRDAGLPKPRINTLLHGFLVDVHWPQWRLVVELDSRRFHSSPRAFESDRIRDTVLQRHGQRIMRVTWKRLQNEPDQVLADIYALRQLPASPPAAHPPP